GNQRQPGKPEPGLHALFFPDLRFGKGPRRLPGPSRPQGIRQAPRPGPRQGCGGRLLGQRLEAYRGLEGKGGGRASISVGTAIERAPLLPTARTAKKWLSVDTPCTTVCPAPAAKPYTCQRASVVSRHKISNPARSGSSPASQETLASGVTAPARRACR